MNPIKRFIQWLSEPPKFKRKPKLEYGKWSGIKCKKCGHEMIEYGTWFNNLDFECPNCGYKYTTHEKFS